MSKLKEFNVAKLDEIYDKIKELCYGISLVGSSINPYINNPGDYDLVITTDSKEKIHKIYEIIRTDYVKKKEPLRLNYSFCIKVKLSAELIPHERPFENIYCYQQKWIKQLKGEKPVKGFILENPDSLLEHLPEFHAYCKLWYKQWVDIWKAHTVGVPVYNRTTKFFYHFYMDKCIIENKSYELTLEQIKKLNIIHDCSDGYEQIIEELNNFYCLDDKGEN